MIDAIIGRNREQVFDFFDAYAAIGINTRHLSAVKAAELRNHFYHELGATKVACLWVLEHTRQK